MSEDYDDFETLLPSYERVRSMNRTNHNILQQLWLAGEGDQLYLSTPTSGAVEAVPKSDTENWPSVDHAEISLNKNDSSSRSKKKSPNTQTSQEKKGAKYRSIAEEYKQASQDAPGESVISVDIDNPPESFIATVDAISTVETHGKDLVDFDKERIICVQISKADTHNTEDFINPEEEQTGAFLYVPCPGTDGIRDQDGKFPAPILEFVASNLSAPLVFIKFARFISHEPRTPREPHCHQRVGAVNFYGRVHDLYIAPNGKVVLATHHNEGCDKLTQEKIKEVLTVDEVGDYLNRGVIISESRDTEKRLKMYFGSNYKNS